MEKLCREGVHPSQLTSTFREAINFSRLLGVRYLWIDSLCIVQDRMNPGDWLQESQHMEKIYAHGYVNISATAASSGNEGLFRQRNPQSLANPAPLERKPIPGGSARYVELTSADYVKDNVLLAPLQWRAWVHQERILSPRTLHFAKTEVFWECCETFASESFPGGIPHRLPRLDEDYSISSQTSLVKQPMQHLSDPHTVELETESYRRWWTIQTAYSTANLTYAADDKTLAIAGVARRFEPLLRDQYAAGCWQERLPTELLWETDIYLNPRSRESSREGRRCYIPSFSWLSAPAPVRNKFTLDFRQEGSEVSVLGLELNFVSQDHTGFVSSALLWLWGRLCRIVHDAAQEHDDSDSVEPEEHADPQEGAESEEDLNSATASVDEDNILGPFIADHLVGAGTNSFYWLLNFDHKKHMLSSMDRDRQCFFLPMAKVRSDSSSH